jgi:adenylate cyclase
VADLVKVPSFPEILWRAYLTGDHSQVGKMVHTVKAVFRHLPSDPRCLVCAAPFKGPGSILVSMLGFGVGRSSLNPSLCSRCEDLVKANEVGIETEVTLMFADVRGSTSLAQGLGPIEFHKLIDRFYNVATEALIASDALIEKLIGDEVAGIYAPGIAGPNHAARALQAATALLEGTGHRDPGGPWAGVGAGIHTGVAYVGAVGSANKMSVITVLGDAANTAARLASSAAAGEILVSTACGSAGVPLDPGTERRSLELRGRAEPLEVGVLRVGKAGGTAPSVPPESIG